MLLEVGLVEGEPIWQNVSYKRRPQFDMASAPSVSTPFLTLKSEMLTG